jgi:DNA-binding transcriptional LysR family regulator
LHLVRQGLAVGFFPRSLIAEALAREELVERQLQDMPPLERRSAVVRRSKARALDPLARDFVEALRVRAVAMGLLPPSRLKTRSRTGPSTR